MTGRSTPQKFPMAYLSRTDRLNTRLIQDALKTTSIGRAIYLFASLQSTNRTAMKWADRSATGPGQVIEGSLILAEAQTQGRGRLGRRWLSPPGVNIYASFILFPRIPVADTPLITSLSAVSVAQAIREHTRVRALIKWPNDVLIHEKKVAGILTELETAGDRVRYVVVGIGINVNWDLGDLPDELRKTATSLQRETGKDLDRNKILAVLCNKLEANYQIFLNQGPGPILQEFRALCATLGRRVRVTLQGKTIDGWAREVDPRGALILQTASNTREVIHSGDLIHLRKEESSSAARN